MKPKKKMSDEYKRTVVRRHLNRLPQELIRKDIWFFEQLLPYKDEPILKSTIAKVWLMSETSAGRKIGELKPTKILKLRRIGKLFYYRFDYIEYLNLKEMEQ